MAEDEIAISFGAGTSGHQYLTAGWSFPERGGTWSDDTRSGLVLPRPGRGDCEIVLDISPEVSSDLWPRQRVAAEVNGTPIAQVSLSARTRLALWVSAAVLDRNTDVELVLRLPDCVQPAALWGTADQRALGIFLHRVELRPLDPDRRRLRPIGRPVPLPELMTSFESLGVNCELGLVQRHFGADPLGLLRFGLTRLSTLIAMLNDDLREIGNPSTTEVVVEDDEYMVHDRCYGLRYHTWITPATAALATVRQQELIRLPFLKRKLLEDLAEAEKLFVYRGETRLVPEEVEALLAALRRHGPNKLLLVEEIRDGRLAGSVEPAAPDLLRGYVTRLAPLQYAIGFLPDDWLMLLRNAHQAWRMLTAAPLLFT